MINFTEKINPGDVIAVGDIHARYDILDGFLEWVKGSGARVILLGDVIDRGGEDMDVLDRIKTLLDDPEAWGLESFSMVRGNHEQLFIDAMLDTDRYSMTDWIGNGGNIEKILDMRRNHLGWLHSLPVMITVGDTMFVHAGVVPGVDPQVTLNDTGLDKLVWIREPFLTLGPKLDKWTNTIKKVVHGHSIQENLPDVGNQRVGIDTGAFYTGILTTYNATQDTYHQIVKPANPLYR